MLCYYAQCRILSTIMLNVIMMSAIMPNVVMLSDVAPVSVPGKQFQPSLIFLVNPQSAQVEHTFTA